MDRYVPYEKLSKRMKKEADSKRRGTWGDINPVTRRSENPRAYTRKTRRDDEKNIDFASFVLTAQHHAKGNPTLTRILPVC